MVIMYYLTQELLLHELFDLKDLDNYLFEINDCTNLLQEHHLCTVDQVKGREFPSEHYEI